jgi:thioredoxin 1
MARSAIVGALVLAAVLSAGCQQASRSSRTYPATGLPRLVDIGASACIPCMMMAPAMDELKKEYAGRLEVEFIDAWTHPGAKIQYDALFCPTQVFIDASGQELGRHVGYYSKADILAKWKEVGVDLETPVREGEAPAGAASPEPGSQ